MADEIQLMAAGLGRLPEGEVNAGLNKVHEVARSIVNAAEARAAEMRASGDYSRSGMARVLDQFITQEDARLQGLADTELKAAARTLDTFKAAMARKSAPPAVDSAARAIELAEVRAIYLDMPEEERIKALAEAQTIGDELLLAAVFGAPAIWKRRAMPGELLARWEAEWRERADPVMAQKIADLEQAITATIRAVAGARQLLSEVPGLSDQARASMRAKAVGDPLVAAA